MKKPCKLANQEHLKNCEVFVKTKNEDSRGRRRLYSGRNSVPKFQGKLFEDEDLKTTKSAKLGPRRQCHAPRACEIINILLGHIACAKGI